MPTLLLRLIVHQQPPSLQYVKPQQHVSTETRSFFSFMPSFYTALLLLNNPSSFEKYLFFSRGSRNKTLSFYRREFGTLKGFYIGFLLVISLVIRNCFFFFLDKSILVAIFVERKSNAPRGRLFGKSARKERSF